MGFTDPDWKPQRPEEAPTQEALNVIPDFDNLGWAGQKVAEAAYEEYQDSFSEFQVIGAEGAPVDSRGAVVNMWDATKKLNNGQQLSVWRQETGDCVSMGDANGVDYLAANEIVRLGDPETLRRAFPPFIYSCARVLIGQNRLRGSAGAAGSWGALALQRYGNLAKDNPGVPAYSKAVADSWGDHAPSTAFLTAAKPYTVQSIARITNYEAARDALANYYPVTIASSWVPQMGAKRDGDRLWGVGAFSRRSGHQMVLIAVDDAYSRPCVYVLNSWSAGAHGTPLKGEPLGGFWITADLLNKILAQNDSFALSRFNGFPGQPQLNFNVIGE